jgi:5'-3' exonuclease
VFGDLSDKGSATGVIYGFLKELLYLRERFDSNRFVFCWDYGENLRKKILPDYKGNREEQKHTKAERAFDKAFHLQMDKLRDEYLYTIGFRNVFYQDGYEADDIIAIVCKNITLDLEEGIIVTADQDLFQCIRSNIKWYDPKKKQLIGYGKFKKMWAGLKPKQYAKLLAIAGCKSDNVRGIYRVGPVAALSFIQKRSIPTTKANIAIREGWKSVVLRNRRVVELPFKGTKPVTFLQDKVTQEGWNEVTKKLGMKSIRFKRIV